MKSITVRLDEELKSRAENVLDTLDVNPTQAITHLYQYIAVNGRLPFRVNITAETPEDVYREALRRATAVSKSLDAMQNLPNLGERSALELSAFNQGVVPTMFAAADAATYIRANRDFMNTLRPRGDGSFHPEVSWPLVAHYLTQAETALSEAAGTFDLTDAVFTTARFIRRHTDELAAYLNAPEACADIN